MPARHKFTHEQIEELEQAYRSSKSKLAEKHIRAVLLYAQGKPYAEICETTGYSETNISKLVTSYSREGLKAIQDTRRRGAFVAISAGDSQDRSRKIAALEAALNSSSDFWEKRRLTAILLSLKRVPMKTIMQRTRYSEAQIRRLCGEYLENGLEEYLSHKYRPYNDERLWVREVTPQRIGKVKKAYETAARPAIAQCCKLVLLRMQGMANKQAAKETGMSNAAASKAFCIYKKEGLPALKLHAEHITKTSASRIPKFTEEQAQEVQQAFDREQRLKDKALLEVLVLRAQGATLEKIKNKTGFGMAIIRKEIKAYLKYGLPKSPHGGGVTY